MHRQSFIAAALTFAGVASSPGPLVSQVPVRPIEPRVEVRPSRGAERVMEFVMSRRARLGLKVNLRARDTDSIGAYVDAVTPNGPAAKAGIRSGDIITTLNGKSVLAGAPVEASGDQESLPGLRLIELAAGLEPHDTIAVELRRGKERKTVSVITADEPDILFRGGPEGRAFSFRYRPDGPSRMRAPFEGGEFEGRLGGAAAFLFGSLADLELAPLNPDLGRYFGATSGVLVISVPQDSDLGLKGGDVVLAVDGRKPESPSHLLRILRSYNDGETFKVDILRNRKRETVSGRLGEQAAGQ